ncbi:MAG: RND transporter, partial [Acidimicrobiales bacterium]
LEVTAQIPEADIGSIHGGESATFVLSALGGPSLGCRVYQMDPNALRVNGSVAYDVVLRLDSRPPKGALPGLTGSVSFHPGK